MPFCIYSSSSSYYYYWETFTSALADGLSLKFEWLQVFSNLNIVVVWMVSTRPLFAKSSSPCINPSLSVPRSPIIIGIIFTFSFQRFFQSPNNLEVLILLFIFFQFYSVVSKDSKFRNFIFVSFSRRRLLVIFHYNTNNSNTPQVSRSLLRVLILTMLKFGWSRWLLQILNLWGLFHVF